jgi:hypothetical protein
MLTKIQMQTVESLQAVVLKLLLLRMVWVLAELPLVL